MELVPPLESSTVPLSLNPQSTRQKYEVMDDQMALEASGMLTPEPEIQSHQ